MILFFKKKQTEQDTTQQWPKLWKQIDRADYTDWISFLLSNLKEEISHNTKPLNSME